MVAYFVDSLTNVSIFLFNRINQRWNYVFQTLLFFWWNANFWMSAGSSPEVCHFWRKVSTDCKKANAPKKKDLDIKIWIFNAGHYGSMVVGLVKTPPYWKKIYTFLGKFNHTSAFISIKNPCYDTYINFFFAK